MDYQPGGSFSVVCPNDEGSVRWLLGRLGLGERADCPMSLALLAGTKKRRAAVPDHIPAPLCTPRHVLLSCCEIHSPLKKVGGGRGGVRHPNGRSSVHIRVQHCVQSFQLSRHLARPQLHGAAEAQNPA